ncbi:MAG: PAS domain S-box protein, partial [Methanococcaceae archaeon]
ELKDAYEALSESENRYRLLFNNSMDAVILTDPRGSGNILSANPAACKMLGWSEEELIGKGRDFIFDPEDSDVATLLDERASSGSARSQLTYKCKDGTKFIGELSTALFTDISKEPRSVAIIRDITERKRVENALLESEELYRTLFNSISEGFAIQEVVYDDKQLPVDLKFIDVNSAYEQLIGRKRADIIGRLRNDLFAVADPYWLEKYNSVVFTGEPAHFENYSKAAGRYFEVYAFPIKPPRFGAIFMDVTDHKAAEEALRGIEASHKVAEAIKTERERLISLLNMLPVYVILLSPDYHVPFANRFFEERFGKSEGRPCYEYLFQRTEPCENCETYKVFKTGSPHHWEWTGPDGRNYDIYDYPFNDSDGSSLIMEVGIDITEMKQAHMIVQAERQRLFNALETLPVMICMLTPDYHVAFANRSFREKFGESEGRHCYKYCFGLTKPCEFCESYKVLETGQPHHWEVTGPDGSVIDAYDFPFTDIDGSPLILEMEIDITEHRKAIETLAKFDEIRIKEIHHRIKNNLQVISSLLDLQAETFSHLEVCKVPQVIEAFTESQNRVASMALIHEELYRGKESENLDFASYLRKLTANLLKSYNLRNNGLNLKLNLEEIYLDMDTAIPLGIIVNELVTNSFKHAFSKRNTREISITLEKIENFTANTESFKINNSCKENFCYVLRVADNGKGIPKEVNLQTVNTLGLQLVNILVDQIDGCIELKRDHGTEFTILFSDIAR